MFCKMAAAGHFGWPKITFALHFSPFQINTQLLFFFKYGLTRAAILEVRFAPKTIRVLPLCVINGYANYEVNWWICDAVRDATSFLSIFIQNGRQRPFCIFRLMTKIIGVLVIWDLNGYGEYEFDSMYLWQSCWPVPSVGVRRRRFRRRNQIS